MILTMLMRGGYNFYYVNECKIDFGVKFGSTSPSSWNQLVSAGLLSTVSLSTTQENSLQGLCRMQASDRSHHPASLLMPGYLSTLTSTPTSTLKVVK